MCILANMMCILKYLKKKRIKTWKSKCRSSYHGFNKKLSWVTFQLVLNWLTRMLCNFISLERLAIHTWSYSKYLCEKVKYGKFSHLNYSNVFVWRIAIGCLLVEERVYTWKKIVRNSQIQGKKLDNLSHLTKKCQNPIIFI